MAKSKFGVAVADGTVEEIDELVEECADLDVSRSEVVEAVLTAYLQADVDQEARVRELVRRRRDGSL